MFVGLGLTPTATASIQLVFCALGCIAAAVYFWRRGGDGLFLRVILIGNYLVSYVISGMVHVWRLGESRGYFDALAGVPAGEGYGLVAAAAATTVGLLALIIGLIPISQRTRRHSHVVSLGRTSRLSLMVGGLLLVITVAALLRVRGVAAALDSDRIIAVSGGEARFVALAGWLPWAVALIALALVIRTRTTTSAWVNTLILLVSVATILASTMWNGGRAQLVFTVFPLIVAMYPYLGKIRLPLIGAGCLALIPVVTVLTLGREGNPTAPGRLDVGGLIDWQWGRFSMVAWADRYASIHGGILEGETIIRGLFAVPNAYLHLLRLDVSFGGRSLVEITGEWFRGTSEQIFIVPGLTAELLLNFGMVGVAVGYLLLGWITGRLADWFRDTPFEWTRILIAYLATIIVFQAPVAQFEALFQTIFTDLLIVGPLIILERILYRRERGRRVGIVTAGVTGGTASPRREPARPPST